MRRKLPVLLLVLSLAAVLPGGASSATDPGCSLTYHVTLVPDADGRVEIALGGVSASQVTLTMLDPITRQIDCSQGVAGVSAMGPGGVPLPVARVETGWCVDIGGHDSFTFTYSFSPVLAADLGDVWTNCGLRRVTATGAFIVHGAVLAYPNIPVAEARVVFDVPPEWIVGTTLIPDPAGGPNAFRVEGIPDLKTDLLDNVTRFGVAEEVVTKTEGDLEATFIAYRPIEGSQEEFWHPYYGNSRREQMEEYLQLALDAIKYFRSLFGFWPGGSRYLISTFAVPGEEHRSHWCRWMQPYPRERYSQMVHCLLQAWILWAPVDGQDHWRNGLEMFYEAELTPELTDQDEWRGIVYADYLVAKRAAQFGLLGKLTVARYAVGHLRAVAVDRVIEEYSKGTQSMADLLRQLAGCYGPNSRQPTRNKIIAAINAVAGTDLTDFYMRYLAGEVGGELPPVEGYMDEYREPFLTWLQAFADRPSERGGPGAKTLVLVSMEIGLHKEEFFDTEHIVVAGSVLPGLDSFAALLRGIGHAVTEQDVISALSELTGVDESDFFEFYTVGDFRPSVEEIQEWLKTRAAGPGPAYADPAVAHLSPSAIPIGVPTKVQVVIGDECLVAANQTTRLDVAVYSTELLGRMLGGTQGHWAVRSDEWGGPHSFEVGYVPLRPTEDGWVGTVTLTLPEDLKQIALRATDESDYYVPLAVQLLAPSPSHVVMMVGQREYTRGGELRTLDVAPFIESGRTFVPVRFVAEEFGAVADWEPKDAAVQMVTLTKPGFQILITIGSATLLVTEDGASREVQSDAAAFVRDGRTCLPFRVVAEAFGASVDYGPKDGPVEWVSFEQ